jgi:hypothetical protein
MPYKDPEKQKAAMRRISKKWKAEHPEKVKLIDWQKHQKSIEKRRASSRKRNRAVGHAERPKGPKSKPELIVPMSRKWQMFTGPDGVTRLYFTHKKGFELAEVMDIVKQFKALRAQQLKLAANLP